MRIVVWKKKQLISAGFILPQILITMAIILMVLGLLLQWAQETLRTSVQERMAIVTLEDGRFGRVVASNSIRFFNGPSKVQHGVLYLQDQTMSDREHYMSSWTNYYAWKWKPRPGTLTLDVNGSGDQPVTDSSTTYLGASLITQPGDDKPLFQKPDYGTVVMNWSLHNENNYSKQVTKSSNGTIPYYTSVEWEPYYERFAVFAQSNQTESVSTPNQVSNSELESVLPTEEKVLLSE